MKIIAITLVTLTVAVAANARTVPSCPTGSQQNTWRWEGQNRYNCKLLPVKKDANGLERCLEWENTHWSNATTVPCGSSVSTVSDSDDPEPDRFDVPSATELKGVPTIDKFASRLRVIRGRRFRVVNEGDGNEILQDMLDKIPKQKFVDLMAMYEAMQGLDGTTTLQGLAKSRASFIGKYYILQGDVFQIQAERNYPLDGVHQFAMFGQVNLVGNNYIPVNVECISIEKVPPYQLSPVLGQIVDFKLRTNRAGKAIIVPVVQVVAVLGLHRFGSQDEEIIINQQ
jgi:hypothetical protein